MALPDILSELEACGYRTRVFHIPASGVGARHHRYRVAIVGYSEHNGLSPSEIAGRTQTTGGGQQEREKKTGKSAGTGKSRNYEDVANTYAERELQSAGNKQDIGNGIGISCKTLANAEGQSSGRLPFSEESEKSRFSLGGKNVGDSHSAGLQKERTKQQTTGFTRTSKDVQHSNGTGCEEQHVSAEPDKEGFAGRGCNARASAFSDTNNRSWYVRRDGEFPTIKEAERSGSNIGGRAQEHEPGERRPVESVLGGVASRISNRMDGDLDFIINHYWDEEPDIPRIATGIKNRVDRLKCLGNAVVPQQFYPIFKAIAEIERGGDKFDNS